MVWSPYDSKLCESMFAWTELLPWMILLINTKISFLKVCVDYVFSKFAWLLILEKTWFQLNIHFNHISRIVCMLPYLKHYVLTHFFYIFYECRFRLLMHITFFMRRLDWLFSWLGESSSSRTRCYLCSYYFTFYFDTLFM